jgi:hypothetical protein
MKLVTKIKKAIGMGGTSTRSKKSAAGKLGGYKTGAKRAVKSLVEKGTKKTGGRRSNKSTSASSKRSGKRK